MPRERKPPQTNVRRQIFVGVQLGAVAVGALFLLYLCVREPVRRLTLDHLRYVAAEPISLPFEVLRVAAGHLDRDAFADLVLVVSTPAGSQMLTVRGSALRGVEPELNVSTQPERFRRSAR